MKIHQLTDEELAEFVQKVEKLKAEGLPTYALLERLGVTRKALGARLRRHRDNQEKGKDEGATTP